jgi:hypothetical protein
MPTTDTPKIVAKITVKTGGKMKKSLIFFNSHFLTKFLKLDHYHQPSIYHTGDDPSCIRHVAPRQVSPFDNKATRESTDYYYFIAFLFQDDAGGYQDLYHVVSGDVFG